MATLAPSTRNGRRLAFVEQPQQLSDTFNRAITYMRISVTDRCNLRCVYCMPEEGMPWLERQHVLTYEEIAHIIRAAAELGVRRLRITGGEPLIRRDLPRLVAMLRAIPDIEDLALSTNGLLLPEQAEALKDAGLTRVNVSLDTLRPERFRDIARRDGLDKVLAALEAAERYGFHPIKINCVVMRGKNDDELADLARLTIERPWHMRFIEIMPLEGSVEDQTAWYMPADEILDRVRSIAALEPTEGPTGNGPARYYRFPSGKGTVGVISPLSHNYCDRCNRVRLTADGQLRLCLFGDNQIDLRTPLRGGATIEDLQRIFRRAMRIKPERHHLQPGQTSAALIALSQTGG
ncbi:MAG: GTP 3',8-cyclase MoaA [Chloroflexi bacterium]|nr:GTP 3',8-cyclase MoaA [Chloroflexota bacterium]